MSKHCNQCSTTKPLSEFYKQKGNVSGYRSMCKECFKAKSILHHYSRYGFNKEYTERYQERQRKRREKNEYKEYQKKYRAKRKLSSV